MTVERTLARVEDDLRIGDVTMARTRLQSLLQSLPHRLDARERLADVYRLDGNRVEAGRWSYLSEHRDPGEVTHSSAPAAETRFGSCGHFAGEIPRRQPATSWRDSGYSTSVHGQRPKPARSSTGRLADVRWEIPGGKTPKPSGAW